LNFIDQFKTIITNFYLPTQMAISLVKGQKLFHFVLVYFVYLVPHIQKISCIGRPRNVFALTGL